MTRLKLFDIIADKVEEFGFDLEDDECMSHLCEKIAEAVYTELTKQEK